MDMETIEFVDKLFAEIVELKKQIKKMRNCANCNHGLDFEICNACTKNSNWVLDEDD